MKEGREEQTGGWWERSEDPSLIKFMTDPRFKSEVRDLMFRERRVGLVGAGVGAGGGRGGGQRELENERVGGLS